MKSSIRTAGPRWAGKEAVSAHAVGFNSIPYEVATVGGFDAEGRMDFNRIKNGQIRTLEKRMREMTAEFPDIKWCSRRDLSPRPRTAMV